MISPQVTLLKLEEVDVVTSQQVTPLRTLTTQEHLQVYHPSNDVISPHDPMHQQYRDLFEVKVSTIMVFARQESVCILLQVMQT